MFLSLWSLLISFNYSLWLYLLNLITHDHCCPLSGTRISLIIEWRLNLSLLPRLTRKPSVNNILLHPEILVLNQHIVGLILVHHYFVDLLINFYIVLTRGIHMTSLLDLRRCRGIRIEFIVPCIRILLFYHYHVIVRGAWYRWFFIR